MRTLALVIAVTAAAACSDNGPNPVIYPAKAVDAAPTVWGTSSGLSIAGGYGSAIVVDPNDPSIFYMMTDRGPNTTTPTANQLLFPMPNFTPSIGKFQLSGDSLRLLATIPIKNAAGVNISGRPNPAGQGATGETGIDPTGAPIPTDPEGLDSEGLAIASDGSFWISDEYGPHILHIDATGKTIERINPFGTGTGGRRIPLVFARRRANRGMEGLAISTDGKTLIGAMQNPLDNPTAAIGRLSNTNRLLTFDISTGTTKQYVYVADAVGNFISEIQALTATSYLVIERDANYQGGTPAAVSKRVYRIEIGAATDVSDPANTAGGKTWGGKELEAQTPAERTTNAIVPVTKTLVYDLLTLPGGYPHDKLEGVTFVGSDLLVVSNDDDFGIIDGGSSTFVAKNLPATSQRDRVTVYFIRLAAPIR